MRRIKLIPATITAIVVAILSNLAASFIFQGLNVSEMKSGQLMLSLLGIMIPYFGLVFTQMRREAQDADNPDHPLLLGWYELITAVALALSGAITYCFQVNSDGPVPGLVWVPMVSILLGAISTSWPSEIRDRYHEMATWIRNELLQRDVVPFGDVLRRFVPEAEVVDAVNRRIPLHDTRTARKYLSLLEWFFLNEQENGNRIVRENNTIVRNTRGERGIG